MAKDALLRIRMSQTEAKLVENLVKNHMRLGSVPSWTKPATRRLMRDLGDQLDDLFTLVEADLMALKPDTQVFDLDAARKATVSISMGTSSNNFNSPLTGDEIKDIFGMPPGPEIGRLKRLLEEGVIDGELEPNNKEMAIAFLKSHFS